MRYCKKIEIISALEGRIKTNILIVLTAACFVFSTKGWCNEIPGTLLDSANNAYSKGNFQKAANYYEKILSQGYESPAVYFNLGNTYYKLDKIGMSVLNYERAKKLSPYDEDILFNLNLANQRTPDKIEPAPGLFLEEWWNTLKSMHSEKTWAIRSIVCFVLFLSFLGVFLTSNRIFVKQFGFWLSVSFFILSAITFSISRSRYYDIKNKDTAVILSSSAEIKNAPSENGTKLFILHEGTKVSTLEFNSDWVKIQISSDKVGWVKRSSLELI